MEEAERTTKETVPVYPHNCDTCIFLGKYDDGDDLYDLYYCPKKRPTVLARYGIGSKYLSGLPFARPDGIPALYEAKKRAFRLKLMTN